MASGTPTPAGDKRKKKVHQVTTTHIQDTQRVCRSSDQLDGGEVMSGSYNVQQNERQQQEKEEPYYWTLMQQEVDDVTIAVQTDMPWIDEEAEDDANDWSVPFT